MNNKTPTWQWVATGAISLLLFFASFFLYETRADIKEWRQATIAMDLRVTSIEKVMPLQFEAIREWRTEINTNLEQIKADQRITANLLTKSAMTLKEWKGLR